MRLTQPFRQKYLMSLAQVPTMLGSGWATGCGLMKQACVTVALLLY